jgi:hypothetical protein
MKKLFLILAVLIITAACNKTNNMVNPIITPPVQDTTYCFAGTWQIFDSKWNYITTTEIQIRKDTLTFLGYEFRNSQYHGKTQFIGYYTVYAHGGYEGYIRLLLYSTGDSSLTGNLDYSNIPNPYNISDIKGVRL